jgi:hypothetical protein
MIDKNRQFIKDHFNESATGKNREIISEKFREIINSYSLENDSNTPDFILADYLVDCLENFHITQSRRAMWYNPENKK